MDVCFESTSITTGHASTTSAASITDVPFIGGQHLSTVNKRLLQTLVPYYLRKTPRHLFGIKIDIVPTRLLTLLSQPNDVDNADDEEDILKSDDEFTDDGSSSEEDQDMDMGPGSEDEIVHQHDAYED